MRSKQVMHGCVGLLSLLGFVGVFTPHREFLAFFAFAVDFEYFFLASDEMLEGYMDRSAARAFCWGMVAVVPAFLVFALLQGENVSRALLYGIAAGWAVAVVVYALSVAYWGFREKWGLDRDDPQ